MTGKSLGHVASQSILQNTGTELFKTRKIVSQENQDEWDPYLSVCVCVCLIYVYIYIYIYIYSMHFWWRNYLENQEGYEMIT